MQGKVADVVHGCSRHAESQNELNAFRILAATAHPDAWQEQPFSLEYHADGCKHRYTPDVLIVWGSHRQVVEIKEDRDAHAPKNQERFRLIGERLAEHSYGFRVWRRSEISPQSSLAYSALACFRMGMPGSASFQSVRKSSYAIFALSLSPDRAKVLPNCKCANAPIGSSPTMPR